MLVRAAVGGAGYRSVDRDPAEIKTKRVKKQQKIDRKYAQLLLWLMQEANPESFCFTIAVVQTQLAALNGVPIQKSDLLKTRVVSYVYQ